MKRTLTLCLLLFLGGALFTSLRAQNYPPTSYTLSDDGKTLLKWLGTESEIDLATDPTLALVKTIGKGAFTQNETLKHFKSGNVELIQGGLADNEGAFEHARGLESMVLPEVSIIEDGALFMAVNLKSIRAPKLTKIGLGSLTACSLLEELEVPMLAHIGGNAIAATNLVNLNLPKIESLGNNCLSFNFKLETLELGETLKVIKENVIQKCADVRTLTVHALVPPTIDQYTFSQENFTSIILVVPPAALEAYEAHPYWKRFNRIQTTSIDAAIQAKKLEYSMVQEGVLLSGLEPGCNVSLYSLGGELLFSDTARGNEMQIELAAKGIYLIRACGQTLKVGK